VKARAFVASVGARCALGHAAAELGFLLRTGIPVLAAAPLARGEGEQVTMGFDATLDPYLVGEERAAALAVTALDEAVTPLLSSAQPLTAKLILCLDAPLEPVPRGQPAPGARLAHLVHTRAKELVPGIVLEIAARSGPGAAFAVMDDLEALASRKLDVVVLGGVHTDYDPETIATLDEQERIFTPENLDAIVPGEAAAFAVLTREDTARRLGCRPAARLGGVGTAVGGARADGEGSAFDATALGAALRAAGEELTETGLRAGWAICDHTFEARRIMEWQAAVTRTHALWGQPHHLDAPAQRIGHLGAAALPLAMVLASEAWRRGYAPSGVALAFAGSDAGERGAMLLYSNV
jgi:3-oxoacyl-[acyl-carrier-protein] synthase-1